MFVAGVDGCRAGWVWFKVVLPALTTSVEVVDLSNILRNRPSDLAYIGIDIPIGLLDGSRACDKAARELLGQLRGSSVFSAPCRAALAGKSHAEGNEINREKTTRGLSQQAWGIVPKIKQVDDVITLDCQQWAVEVHPEVCFWALNDHRPMKYNKKTKAGPPRGSLFCVRVSPRLKDISQTDRRVWERTIFSMRLRRRGLP
jgi:predicted RNase H-like nuclease